jgi:probable HAF family extracellular repeat protein
VPSTHDFAGPFAINADGVVVGSAGPGPFDPEAFPVLVDVLGAMHALPALTQPFGVAYAINDAGLACGESGRRACVWEDGVLHELEPPFGVFSGSAHAVTAGGLVVGSFGDQDEIGPHHCFWSDRDAEAVLLPGLFVDNQLGSAWAVNASGQIAGVSGGFEGEFYAARWDAVDEPPVRIGPLPGGSNSEARAINGMGDVVGRSSFPNGRIQAFLHVRATDTLVALAFLPGGNYAEAFGVNDDRDVVGTAQAAPGVVHAVLWRAGVVHDLNDLVALPSNVAFLASATAIRNDGTIAVEAFLEDGRRCIAILVPSNSGG